MQRIYILAAGMPKPQCVDCGVVLSNDSMKPSHLKRHLHSKYKISTKPKEFLKGYEMN